jgi:hypothetical protein
MKLSLNPLLILLRITLNLHFIQSQFHAAYARLVFKVTEYK